MQRAKKEVLYFEIGPDNAPTLHVAPGEEFEVETQINRGPWLNDHPDRDSLSRKLRAGNPSSGCIYVEGAKPGQVLVVHIGEIDLDPIGFTQFRGGNGAMPSWLGGSGIGQQQKVVEIRDGNIHWNESLRLPISPMLGVVGVAQKHSRWTNAWAGEWGGNFDIQEITTGASVYLPFRSPAPYCISATCTPARGTARFAGPAVSKPAAGSGSLANWSPNPRRCPGPGSKTKRTS